MMENKTGKRLSKEKWEKIRVLLENPNRNITKIAKKYKIERVTIYQYAWRKNWMRKKKKGIIKRIMGLWE